MVAALVPVTKSDELQERVAAFMDGIGRRDVHNQYVLQRLLKDAYEYQGKVSVIIGSAERAKLNSVVGNLKEFADAVRNIELNGDLPYARKLKLIHAVNHLHAIEALQMLPQVIQEQSAERFQICGAAAAIGAFHLVVETIDKATAQNRVIMATNLIPTSKRAAAVMGELGLTDQDLVAMTDVAGELLRRENQQWLSRLPDLRFSAEGSGSPSLSLDYRISASPTEAANLTWELTEKLIERDLVKAGCSIGFFGVDLPVKVTS